VALRIGNIASGEDFFDRQRELEDLWRTLEGNHVALTGPRRLGKSSLLKRLGEQATDRGLFACFVDLEKLLARDVREAEQLLGWLRAWRMGDTVCRFVFSGSVGINTLLERHSLTTWLNDCYEYKLGPFRPPSARAMLTTLAEREGWRLTDDGAGHLCDKTGWLSPFYLNLLLDEALKAARDRLLEGDEGDGGEDGCESGDGARDIQPADIDDGYDRLLAGRSRFIHWFKRLQRDLAEPHLGFTLAVLRHAARAGTPLSRRQMLARLTKLESDPDRRIARLSDCLAYLEEHGYLGETKDGGIIFLSFLLRDYWRRNHAD